MKTHWRFCRAQPFHKPGPISPSRTDLRLPTPAIYTTLSRRCTTGLPATLLSSSLGCSGESPRRRRSRRAARDRLSHPTVILGILYVCLDIEIAPQGAFLVVGCGTNWSATTGSTGLPDLERISGSAAIGPRDTSPKRRRRIRDLGGELFVGTGNILLKVKTGKVRAPASLACMSDLTEDAGESPLAAGVFESWRPICNRMARAIWLDWVGQTCRKGHE